MNSSGRIAFRGRLTGGVEGMFTRLGNGGVNVLADTGSTEFNFGFGITRPSTPEHGALRGPEAGSGSRRRGVLARLG